MLQKSAQKCQYSPKNKTKTKTKNKQTIKKAKQNKPRKL